MQQETTSPFSLPIYGRAPLQIGMGLVRGSSAVLLLAAVLPIAAQLGLLLLNGLGLLGEGALFPILSLVAESWLMGSVAMLVIEIVRGNPEPPGQVSLRALANLPKVVLCYAGVVTLLAASTVYPLLLLVAVFFFWAPLFVISESYAKPLTAEELEEEFDEETGVPHLFSGQSVVSLGFGRSFGLVMAYLPLTIELLILLLCVKLIPAAAIRFYFGAFPEPEVLAAEVVISGILSIFFYGLTTASFLTLLPKSARSELSLPVLEGDIRPNRPWPLGSAIILFVLSPLSGVSWWYLQSVAVKQWQMPSSVEFTSAQTRRDGNTYIWEALLKDPTDAYRWLNPASLRLTYDLPKPTTKGEVPVPELPDFLRTEPSRPELDISAVYFLNEAGKFIETPRDQRNPVRMQVRFYYPPQLPQERILHLVYPGGEISAVASEFTEALESVERSASGGESE